MKLSSAHKAQLAKVTRVALAGAMVVSSLSLSVAAPASAVALTNNRTTIYNSRPNVTNVRYTITFTPTVTTTAIGAVDIEFCTTADTFGQNCTPATGISINNGTIDASSVAAGFGAGDGNAGTFSAPSTHIARYVTGNEGGTAETPVAHSLDIVGAITNPSAQGTYFARLRTFSDAAATVGLDDGTSAFAIVQSVQVQGRVLESMVFTVGSVPTSTACGTGATSNVSTSATLVNFGNYVLNTPRIGCQTVSTATNAPTGFDTYIENYTAGTHPVGTLCRVTATNCTDDGAQTSISAADTIQNADLDDTPSAWTNGTTFGLGVGANGTEKASQFVNATDYRGFYNSSNVAEDVLVATKASPSQGVNTYVVFRSDVSATQTAGSYTSRLMYTSTPKF